MNWGYFFAWVVCILLLFFVTGWPVTPTLQNVWGNHYNQKDLVYYGVLYFHYLIGALFFTFLGLGLFRNLIWKNMSSRQLIFLLAYSMLLAAIIAVALSHLYAPSENTTVPTMEENSNAKETEAADENNNTATEAP